MPIIPALDVPADIAVQYQTMIARLEESLADPDQCAAAMGTIRSLIQGVVLEPGSRPGEVRAVLRGALSGLIKATTGRELPLSVVLPSVDAGAEVDRWIYQAVHVHPMEIFSLTPLLVWAARAHHAFLNEF